MKIPSLSLLRVLALAPFALAAPAVLALERAPDPAPAAPPAPPAPPAHAHHAESDRATLLSNNHVAVDETVAGDLVAVMGDNVVDGTVRGDVVTVMGKTTINGTVSGDVVTTLGEIYLGPNSEVRGDVNAVGGHVQREPGAIVRGSTHVVPIGARHAVHIEGGAHNFHSLIHPLRSAAAWVCLLMALAFYALLGLVFPQATRRCGDSLAHRPGLSLLTALLAILALPIVFILLCITVIGIPIALLALPLGVIGAVIFGKAAVFGLIGRNLGGAHLSSGLAVLVGGALCSLFYVFPVAGIALSLVLGFLGFGCAVLTLLSSFQRAPAPAVPPVVPPPAAPPAPVAAPAPVPAAVAPAPAALEAQPAAVPPPVSTPPQAAAPVAPATSTLPKAGFWVRMGALLIDALLIGIFAHVWPLAIAVYAAIMWKFKGTTVGGIVFGLQIVRTDDKPIEWETAIVRALGCFLSAIALGLGFLWIVFDAEKQAWHDNIAGTVVVRVKGKSLI
jgi:uncharacterized RDD family membrane protein YckC/cytoskeletal protein CcmA (bactofilin family)